MHALYTHAAAGKQGVTHSLGNSITKTHHRKPWTKTKETCAPVQHKVQETITDKGNAAHLSHKKITFRWTPEALNASQTRMKSDRSGEE